MKTRWFPNTIARGHLMKTFQEFLQEAAPRAREEVEAKIAERFRWISSVEVLFDQLISWLGQSDTEKVLGFARRPVERSDEGLGRYRMDSLVISLGMREVIVDPVAFSVLGPGVKPKEGRWSGRVDLTQLPYSYRMYRLIGSDGQEDWYVFDPDDLEIRPLSKDVVETALMRLFA